MEAVIFLMIAQIITVVLVAISLAFIIINFRDTTKNEWEYLEDISQSLTRLINRVNTYLERKSNDVGKTNKSI